jgi:hypothetical protein
MYATQGRPPAKDQPAPRPARVASCRAVSACSGSSRRRASRPVRPAAPALSSGARWARDSARICSTAVDTDGNLLIDARDTLTTYKVNRFSGKIIWQLGGKDSSFALKAAPGQVLDSADEIFAWQHDPEAIGHHEYTFFDIESSGTPLLPYSRAITVKLNAFTHVAALVASDDQPEGLSAASQGNAQATGDGDLFVGWGALPSFSEFNPAGQLEFPTGVNTYRAYLLPWHERGGNSNHRRQPTSSQG